MNPPVIYVAEAMPANNRIMTFRVTARDGRGLYGFDDVTITVFSRLSLLDIGPFAVTEPGYGAVWPRGSKQTVSWNVAHTNLPPIDCSRVRISLVIRGNESNPIILADNIPNTDASAVITVPSDVPLTTMGRVKVEAVGNIFFNVSVADIQIVEAQAVR